MPKAVHPNRQRVLSSREACFFHCVSPAITMTGSPRKVSFEGGHKSLGSLSSSSQDSVLLNSPKCTTTFACGTVQESVPLSSAVSFNNDVSERKSDSSRSQLRRPAPSMCLVGLAGTKSLPDMKSTLSKSQQKKQLCVSSSDFEQKKHQQQQQPPNPGRAIIIITVGAFCGYSRSSRPRAGCRRGFCCSSS